MIYAPPIVTELFDRCNAISAAWDADGWRLESFAEIVESRTSDLDLRELGDIKVLSSLLEEPTIARHQKLSSFSDLYLRLWDNGYFWVEVLNWWGSDINIHDHDFAGMQFQLVGESINLKYAFEAKTQIGGVHFGEVRLVEATRWLPGDRSTVIPGRGEPHNVCHMSLPTISLLIRTHPRNGWGPQYNYFPPAVASSYGVADVIFRKRVQTLRLLARYGELSELREAALEWTDGAPANRILFTLVKLHDLIFTQERISLLFEICERAGDVSDLLLDAVAHHRAAEQLKALRWHPALTCDQRWALAVVGSAYSLETARTVEQRIRPNCDTPDLLALLTSAHKVFSAPEKSVFEGALARFGVPVTSRGYSEINQ